MPNDKDAAGGGQLSEATVADCLERIAAREETVRAWSHVDADGALAAARALDADGARPEEGGAAALRGMPVGVKDVFDTADQPTAYGFAPYDGFRPDADSAVVRRLRDLGMIVLGKTATTEFASPTPETAPTRNPLDLQRSPGFSSSGSAAAVADGMVPLAIGTQTGASVIRPAAFCGIHGYKPSLDAIDPAGLRHAKPSIDTIGLFARTLPDLLAFAAGFGLEPARRSARPPRIGLCRTRHWDKCSAALKDAVAEAGQALARGGATVVDVSLPGSLDAFDETFETVMAREHAVSMAAEYARWPDELHPWNREQIERGLRVTDAGYRTGLDVAAGFRRDLAQLFGTVDVLLTPSAEDEAPLAEAAVAGPWFRDWTFLHVPCLTLPFGRGAAGLPLGLQFVGPVGGDAELLAAVAWAHACLS